MSALRFCHVTTFYPPYHFGGDGVAVQRLSQALARRGHEVTVVHDVDAFTALHRGPEPESVPVDGEGVRVIGLQSGLGTLSPVLTHQLGRPVAHRRELADLLERGGFDVVNFHNVSLVGGPGVLGLGDALKLYTAHEHWLVCPTHVLWRHRREPCPARQCFRCLAAYRRPPQLWRYTGALERNLAEVDAFIALSEFSRSKHTEFGFAHRMEVVPLFLPDLPIAPVAASAAGGERPQTRPYFLFAGRLERLKGLDDVIPLFDGSIDADLLVAGAGEHEPALRAAARGLAVRFLGRLSSEELERHSRHAVGVVVPSVGFETFGIVILEAFRAGAPVLARRVGPFPEIVGDAGELFATASELRTSMQRLLREPEARAEHGRRGEARLRARFSEQVVVPQYLDLVRRTALHTGRRHVAGALRGEHDDEVGECAPS